MRYNIILKGIMAEIATKPYKNRAKSGKNGRNWAKTSWKRGSEHQILNLKYYLVFWHLLETILLNFYQKKFHIFDLFASLVVFHFL